MGERWRIFKLLMYKNILVRRKYWKVVLFVEVMIPLLLILFGQSVRTAQTKPPTRVDNNTYHRIIPMQPAPWAFELRYAPKNNLTDRIMSRAGRCMRINDNQMIGSESEPTMVNGILSKQEFHPFLQIFGIVFENIDSGNLPKKFKYKFRTSTKLPEKLYENVENGNAATLDFVGSPLTLMQICLDRAYIEEATCSPAIDMTVTTQQMPYPPFIYANSKTIAGGVLIGQVISIMFFVIMYVEIRFAINEKDTGINILMSVNGATDVQNLLSWLVSGVIFSVVYLAPIVIILEYFLPYLTYSNGFIIWIVLTIYVCHILAFAMHTTAYQFRLFSPMFFPLVIITLMDIVRNFAINANYTSLPIYLGILSPNIMLNRIFDEINFYENQLIGVHWNNLFTPGDAMAPQETSLGALIVFSILGILIHFLLAVYLYAVRPGMYGIAQHPLYFLQRRNKVLCDREVALPDYNREDRKEFERIPEGTLTPGIQIRDLTKTYVKDFFRRTVVQALKGIDANFYKGQITALVGHDGAGKTTMTSVLSGLTDSTEGMVLIDGKDVQHDRRSVQKNLGFCPQENIVFSDLSVFEQVMFFGMLKAGDKKTKDDLSKEVEILLEKMNLTEKKNSLPDELSGGQKRRMCLAMAVIGDPSVLILDEPTSGMDAESKREVRDIILKLRGDATILIGTHDMEEADILGDRIAIIHSGKLRCYGTSMFLKKLYGDGQVEVTLSTEPSCEPQRIVDEFGLSAQLLSVDDGKVVLAVPFADNLPEALDTLERRKSELGINGLGVSLITLEQVFLRVMREREEETTLSTEAAKSFDKLTGFRYFVQTVAAFFTKKFTRARKNYRTVIVDMLWPSISAILIGIDFIGSPNIRSSSLTLDAYTDTRSIAYAEQNIYGEKYVTSAKGFGGTATYIGPDNNVIDALLASAVDDSNAYRNKFIVSGEFNITNGSIVANGLYSGTARLGVPATINMLTNTIVKVLTGDDEYSISVWAEELPRSYRSSDKPAVSSVTLSLGLLFFLAPALLKYVSQPLYENLSGFKQLQVMTGASKLAYWGCTYLFDLLQYTVTIISLIVAFVIADASYGTQYYHGTEIMTYFLLLFVFGASVLPLVYIFTFWKKTSDKYLLLNMAPLVLIFGHFLSLGPVRPVNEEGNDVLRLIQSRIFLLLPHTTVIYGHMSFFDTVMINSRCRRMSNAFIEAICSHNSKNLDQCCYMNCWNGRCDNPAAYFVHNGSSTVLSDSMMLMAGSALLFFGIIYVLEKKIPAKLHARFRRTPLNSETETADELVEEEAHKVKEELDKMLLNKNDPDHARNENILFVRELSKSYGSLNAVKGVSFRVKRGECFGLLGVNGAGKSTTFRVLTGEELPNSGVMYLNGCSLDKEQKNYLAEIGYCPQDSNALLNSFDAWDHLNLFARLRGIPNAEVKATVEKWINKLNLTACASEPIGTYSNGNKRRLSIAIALIGNPLLVLMDEPTSGMDPAARRSLWKTLKTCQEDGQSIILTSQSMEECEALCNRLVIMRKGQLVCVGTRQELKQRFGVGYNIHVKLNPGCQRSDVEEIKNRIGTTLVCKLTDENKGFIGYHVTDREATWTKMYTLMNALKADYDCIEDFAVLSSTLEQLFIQFARDPFDANVTDAAESAPALQDTEKESKKDL